MLKDGSRKGSATNRIPMDVNVPLNPSQPLCKDLGGGRKNKAGTILNIFLWVEKKDILGSSPNINGKNFRLNS